MFGDYGKDMEDTMFGDYGDSHGGILCLAIMAKA
jgi:hypothetical protein